MVKKIKKIFEAAEKRVYGKDIPDDRDVVEQEGKLIIQKTTKAEADAFGPKVSKFMQNLLGTSDENVPDVWFTRGFNRKRGTMFNVTQDGNRTMIAAPRTLKERQFMDKYIEDTRNTLKTKYNIELNNRDTQAVLWYFEQGLYTKLGVRSEPTDYETITRTLIEGKTNDRKGSLLPSTKNKTKNQKTTAEPITIGEIPNG